MTNYMGTYHEQATVILVSHDIAYSVTHTLLSVRDIVSSVRASLERLWISLSCVDTGAYETWYGFGTLIFGTG